MSAPVAVAEIYEAFGRGDAAAIVARCADDVEWDVFADPGARAQIPWLVARRDPAGVGEFFAVVGGDIEIHDFRVLSIVGDEHNAVAEIAIDSTIRATGKRFSDEEIHYWKFDEAGKISHFRHYVDVHKHLDAIS